MDHNKILAFWNWFRQISNRLSLNLKDQDLLSELDYHIQNIGYFDWEIGPYSDDIFFLAISPALDKNLLKQTKKIISMAENCPNWIFLASKPEKGWFEKWNMENEQNQTIEVDAGLWKYVLYEYENNVLEMDVFVDKIDGNQDIAYKAVDIALTNLLGEELYINLFENITVIQDVSKFDLGKSSFLSDLKEHLVKLNFL